MSEPQVPPPPVPPPPTTPPASGGSDNRTLMLILSYLGLLALIPLLVEKDDAEVQWHAKHGLVLTASWFVVFFILFTLQLVPGLGCITGILSFLLWIPWLVVTIVCILKATKGERFLIPGVSDFANKF